MNKMEKLTKRIEGLTMMKFAAIRYNNQTAKKFIQKRIESLCIEFISLREGQFKTTR